MLRANEPQIQANGNAELDGNVDNIDPNNTNLAESDNIVADANNVVAGTNNIKTDTTKQEINPFQLTNNQNSFIWNYLKKLSPVEKYKKCARCLVSVIGPDGEQPCGHVMETDGSTLVKK
jgi:hypothetical protein